MTRKEITDKFIATIEKGRIPWRKPFAFIAHRNQFTKNIYQGVNQFLLSLDFDATPYWGTFMQWKEAGFSVQKGTKSSCVVFFRHIVKENEDGETYSFPIMRHYPVFHAGQVNDPDGKFTHIIETKIETDFESARRILETCGADIRVGGNRAFYIPRRRKPRTGQVSAPGVGLWVSRPLWRAEREGLSDVSSRFLVASCRCSGGRSDLTLRNYSTYGESRSCAVLKMFGFSFCSKKRFKKRVRPGFLGFFRVLPPTRSCAGSCAPVHTYALPCTKVVSLCN